MHIRSNEVPKHSALRNRTVLPSSTQDALDHRANRLLSMAERSDFIGQPYDLHTILKDRLQCGSPELVDDLSGEDRTYVQVLMHHAVQGDGQTIHRCNDGDSGKHTASTGNIATNAAVEQRQEQYESHRNPMPLRSEVKSFQQNYTLQQKSGCDAPKQNIITSAPAIKHELRKAHTDDIRLTRSPDSSTTSQKKRGASLSPSGDEGRASGATKPKYDTNRGVQDSVLKRKQLARTGSGLRATPLAAKTNHYRAHSTGTVGLPTTAFHHTLRQETNYSFAPALDKLASRQDSGYVSRQSTFPQTSWNPDVRASGYAHISPNHMEGYGYGLAKQQSLAALHKPRYDMVLQPKSSPLTQEQLGAEVKGIYAGLVMVEAKCINMNAARAADPTAEVSKEEWQTLIALHRTLLYEHHDFLMATQHPSANPALRALAGKYCMPARMWKHGIHSFLEVLRHRRPHSQEYMLTFIYLAYQMMCLLFDTIPSYLDTWIECLGDLARYRMAIEEDKEIHAVWCAVAARWYQMAADRHPGIGRLYHHLGILERPSLRKFYFYARSLTSIIPFLNAAESLGTLCAPILQDDTAIRCGNHSAEAMTICFHARVFTFQSKNASQTIERIERDGTEAHNLIKEQPSAKIASYGVALAVTNVAGIFQYGLQDNIFRIMYSEALALDAHNARPSVKDAEAETNAAIAVGSAEKSSRPLESVLVFWSACFNSLIDNELNQAMLRDLMQYVHVNLVFISSLINLHSRITNQEHLERIDDLFKRIKWSKLATFLNAISQIDPITQRVEEHAVHNIFLMPDRPAERKPLVEDYMLRGIVWAENYPSPELFYGIEDDDGSRTIDTPARLHLRAERVLWLACLIAQPQKESGLLYDRGTQRFAARPRIAPVSMTNERRTSLEYNADYNAAAMRRTHLDEISSMSPKSISAYENSRRSSIGEGYDIVSAPDIRSLSSMEDSRISTPMKSFISSRSNAATRGSPERKQSQTPTKTMAADVKIAIEDTPYIRGSAVL